MISATVYVAGNRNDDINRAATERSAHALCIAVRQERIEGNARARVIIHFLETAATARRHDAAATMNAEERRSDVRTARIWHSLVSDVHILPIPTC